MTDVDAYRRDVEQQGYTILHDLLPADFVKHAREELVAAIDKEAEYHGTRACKDYGMVLMCSLYGGAFLELLDMPGVMDPFHAVLGEGCIIYAYTSSSMPPSQGNYSTRIHVDCPRVIPGYVTNMGVTILLDDFTEENGATWFLPSSQTRTEPPTENEFYDRGERLIARAGSAWYFNARVWHAGGRNSTPQWRHALTINMCRPYMKQRIDIPRAMSHMDLSGLSERALQKLGFHAQVPASYDEYYVPPHQRKYKQPVE